jgi:hypothetical protein
MENRKTDAEREAQISENHPSDTPLQDWVDRCYGAEKALDEARAEIARLRAQRDEWEARWLALKTETHVPPEFLAHGDQRARETVDGLTLIGWGPTDVAKREARDSLREQGYCMVCGVYHRVGACEAVENARREARVAAIEEAAQRIDVEAARHGSLHDGNVRRECAAIVRALANTPPQSEGDER